MDNDLDLHHLIRIPASPSTSFVWADSQPVFIMPHASTSTESVEDSILIAIDRGGTFTDVWASVEGKPDFVFKLLSVDPDHYKDAPTEG